jgi:Spy/CpxP family protein refolding chaperone
MNRYAKWILATFLLACASIASAQAQAPAAPQQQPPGPAGPGLGWGQRGWGPGMGWGQRLGPPQGRGMGMHRGMRGQMGPGTRGLGRMDRGAMLGRLLQNKQFRERIGVTPEQAAKIQSQHSAFSQARIRNSADLAARRMELNQLMAADNPDRALIDKKMREFSDARLAFEKAQFEHRLTMRSAFTPEQKLKLEEWRNNLWQQRMQRGPRMAPGLGGPRRGSGPVLPQQRPPDEPDSF